MKRCGFLALAILLGGAVGAASADFVVIITNLGLTKDKPATPPNPNGGTQPPGSERGGPPGAGGGVYAPPPSRGDSPAAPPGTGSPDGVPGTGTLLEDADGTPYFVMAVVELKQPLTPRDLSYVTAPFKPPDPQGQPQQSYSFLIEHKWGKSILNDLMFRDPSSTTRAILVKQPNGSLVPGVLQQHKAKHTEAHKGGKPTAKQLLDLGEWCLGHGLPAKFVEAMEELAKADPDHPAVKTYKQVQQDLNRPARDDRADAWTGKDKLLDGYKVARKDKGQGHYTLLYDKSNVNEADVKSRLDRLEETFVGFYYWFALRQIALPVPEQRLLAVVVPHKDFSGHHRIFNSMPLTADGFFARRENLAVFSAESLDNGYVYLRDTSKALFEKVDKAQVLKGLTQHRDWTTLDQRQDAHARALMLRALEDESELATVSHEGTRQLMVATGMLPRGVAVPEWAQFGMASLFETPKGAPWGGFGSASPSLIEQYNYLAQFKQALTGKKIDGPTARRSLESVVTDHLFRQADGGKDRVALLKARTLSWSLTYFLANDNDKDKDNKKLEGLLRYYKELAKLPRDLEFDDKVLLACYARAFGLMNIKTNTVDEGKLEKHALEWYSFIQRTPLEMEDVLKEVRKALAEAPRPVAGGTKPNPGGGTKPPGGGTTGN